MRRVVEYRVLCFFGYGEMNAKAKSMIETGWQPIGGIAVDKADFLIQAWVKYEGDGNAENEKVC